MEIIKIQGGKIAGKDLGKALDSLMAGEVVMHATETCYGLAVDIFCEEALRKVYALKGRDFNKPISMMVGSLEWAVRYAEFNPVALELAKKFWPGPLTLVLPRKSSLPDFFNPGVKTVGVRCPDHKVTQTLIKRYGGPLSTTSANISGLPEVYKVEDYLGQLRGLEADADGANQLSWTFEVGATSKVLVLDQGTIAKNDPSTIVTFGDDGIGAAKIIREGSLLKEIKAFLE